MIDELLPASVVCAWTTDEWIDVPLYHEESSALGRAVDKRRREFVTGRACARQALASLGFHSRPVPSGPWGEPVWPHGVVGSITHCRGYVACAVASHATVRALGIDAEPHAALPEEILPDIVTTAEHRRLSELRAASVDVHWDKVWFSAKEAVCKAWFPLTGRWLGLHDIELTVDGRDGSFVAHVCVAGAGTVREPITRFDGRWLIRDALTLTAVVVPHVTARDLNGARVSGADCT